MNFRQIDSWLSRGEETGKQHREKRRYDAQRAQQSKEALEEMRHWAPIKYEKNRIERIDARSEEFTSKPEQELEKLTSELSKDFFNPIRNKLYNEDEIYESLSEIIIDGHIVLSFLGAGFNRAAFLIKSPDGRILVAKIPITDNGVSDNRTEIQLYGLARANEDTNVLARTEPSTGGRYVLQEACKPVSWSEVDRKRKQLISDAATTLGFGDIQAGVSLEDDNVKVYDFAGWI
ncbi:hypothetical protein COV06_00345 [Candidatus Uhrbacteria bacterium CG10_big_fil_rev_8_21_14_0_10_50_16]|uniref:Protein kinase domain-containing protein n=1 Tax=Candidatus Uhrbacteria bacterium CG10_big_fil_rev_8_21_14_0_10_50_16 TaxID=1975039 RepID=A0A2H0RMY9_9BACT|nr:MAG: hypothetical protein COV06_00345 [Candidatus Uhrbacteria bacterium CG10_big_fil_rev_8_21_14_0_10_50_16]